jgi:hypothetical protein
LRGFIRRTPSGNLRNASSEFLLIDGRGEIYCQRTCKLAARGEFDQPTYLGILGTHKTQALRVADRLCKDATPINHSKLGTLGRVGVRTAESRCSSKDAKIAKLFGVIRVAPMDFGTVGPLRNC